MMWGPGGGWIAGLVLIGLGVLFLLRNFGVPIPEGAASTMALRRASLAAIAFGSPISNASIETSSRLRSIRAPVSRPPYPVTA